MQTSRGGIGGMVDEEMSHQCAGGENTSGTEVSMRDPNLGNLQSRCGRQRRSR